MSDIGFYVSTGCNGLNTEQLDRYMHTLTMHKAYVMMAGTEMLGMHDKTLALHDMSKYDDDELYPYARWFQGDRTVDGAEEDFNTAWLRHIRLNPHHWQYYIIPATTTVLPMPYDYVLEMVADWLGASKAYTGSWSMGEWLAKHVPTMLLHADTKDRLHHILDTQLCYSIDLPFMRYLAGVE